MRTKNKKILSILITISFIILLSFFISKDALAICSCKVCHSYLYCGLKVFEDKNCPCAVKCINNSECCSVSGRTCCIVRPIGSNWKDGLESCTGTLECSSGSSVTCKVSSCTPCINCSTPGSPPPEEKNEEGWCCNNSTGDCYSCTKTGAWSTLSQCEAHCPSGTYLECRPPYTTFWGADANKEYCKSKTWYIVDPGDECSPQNSVCPASSSSTISKYSCSGAPNYTCSEDSNGTYSSLSVCEDNCIKPPGNLSCPGNDYCYACNKTTYQCYQSKNGPYTSKAMCQKYCKKPSTGPTSPPPTTPATEPCMIFYFELPERAWVGYPITGRWSASAYCEDCDVDCTSYPECVWKLNNIGIGDIGANEYKFTLSQSGTYDYTLTCYGQGGVDERTETAKVEAINLPWWREIIPVLPGFLRGIWE